MGSSESPNPKLYHGEVLDTIAGYPTINYYLPPDNAEAGKGSKPLIVCIPGAYHLGRIYYGGHEGSRKEDFVAHWLNQKGFGVLVVSYPLDTTPEIIPTKAVNFRVKDWARQAAETTKKIMEEKQLATRSILLITWSMGGRVVTNYNISAKELGLNVQLYVSFAGTPGFSSIRNPPPGIRCRPTGYFEVDGHLESFYKQVQEMHHLNGDTMVIPHDVYFREYTGGTPINLIGLRLKYDGKGAFVQDEITHEEDTQVLNVKEFPLISMLWPTSVLDGSHALTDKAGWGFLLSYNLESTIGRERIRSMQGSPNWQKLIKFVHAAPERLSLPVVGNHFFFIGEKCAREVADKVVKLLDESIVFKAELSDLIKPASS